MDVASFWDQIRSALGLDEPRAAETVARAIQVLIVILLTVGIAHLVGAWVRRAATVGRVYAEVATLLSRATTRAVYAVGATVVLAIVGTSWTAIAAVLGAATCGISLALQDVGRGFVNGVYILIERPPTEIQDAVIASLRGTPHLSHRAPVVELIRSSPDGTDVEVSVEHDLGIRIDDQVIERLRSLFPEATVATKTSAGAL